MWDQARTSHRNPEFCALRPLGSIREDLSFIAMAHFAAPRLLSFSHSPWEIRSRSRKK